MSTVDPAVRDPLLSLEGVSKRFVRNPDLAQRVASMFGAPDATQTVHAVDNVHLSVGHKEVVGLVGESGCGKSTLGRVAAGFHPPTTGRRFWKGRDVAQFPKDEASRLRLAIQMIFQDPYSSLNPRMRVQGIVGEAPVANKIWSAAEAGERTAALLSRVGLDPGLMQRFPHQLSGGQRARVGIARALAVNPELIVCDESVAALDVSIQAQVLNLFMTLRKDFGLSYLFISHDLGVVRHLSDRVVIMYLGRVVESGFTDEIFSSPRHPYTQALLAEIPTMEVRKKTFVSIRGEIPSPLNPPAGCHFHPRCPHAFERCGVEAPRLVETSPGHWSACHLWNALPQSNVIALVPAEKEIHV